MRYPFCSEDREWSEFAAYRRGRPRARAVKLRREPSTPIEARLRTAKALKSLTLVTWQGAMKMRASITIALISCLLSGGTSHAQESSAPRKLLCIIEKAAGVIYQNPDAKESTPTAINFEEQHKRFTVTIEQIVRDQEQRERCQSNLKYWLPILSQKGRFGDSDKPDFSTNGHDNKFTDYRVNIGPSCFASDRATIKFFDRQKAETLETYDMTTHEFTTPVVGGEWFAVFGDNFEAGERLDAGPVVFTGKCQRID